MEKYYWTPLVNGDSDPLTSWLRVFTSKKACDHHIKTTFPKALIKLGNIKPGRIKIVNVD